MNMNEHDEELVDLGLSYFPSQLELLVGRTYRFLGEFKCG